MTSFFVRARKRADGGVGYYVVRVTKRGQRWEQHIVESGIESEGEAKKIKRAAKKAWRDNEHGIERHSPTVNAILDFYLEAISGQSGWDGAERNARLHIRPSIGDIEIGELRRADVQRLIDDKGVVLGPQMLRHVQGTLRAAIAHAMRRGVIEHDDNVARDLELPRATRQVHDTLEPHEAVAILGCIAKHERAMVAFAFYGGFRPGELAFMRPQDIDLDRRIIRVLGSLTRVRRPPQGKQKAKLEDFERQEPKDGDERLVPIADPLVPWVREALDNAVGGKVFPAHRGGRRLLDRKGSEMLRTAMVKASALGAPGLVTGWTLKCRRKGCGFSQDCEHLATTEKERRCPKCSYILWPIGHARNVTFYDLRHTTATLLIEAGVAPAIVTAILGHSTIDFTLQTYVHLKPARLVEAVNKLSVPKAPTVSKRKGSRA